MPSRLGRRDDTTVSFVRCILIISIALLGQPLAVSAVDTVSITASDQTLGYSRKQWVRLPFSPEQIAQQAVGPPVVLTVDAHYSERFRLSSDRCYMFQAGGAVSPGTAGSKPR
jgi:hypothetical protein